MNLNRLCKSMYLLYLIIQLIRMMFKEILLVLCATAAVRTREEFNLNGYIRNVSQMCPFTNYCPTKANDIFHNDKNSPCCSECSCDSYSCYQTGNCCPDLGPSPDTSSDMICSDSMTKFTNKRSSRIHNGYKYGVKQYFIVASCPQNYNDSHVVSKCKGSNKTELGDFLWVSHTENDLIYRNHYCAKCHGLKGWLTWNLRTNCFMTLMDTGFQNLTTALLSDDCDIVNEVPESKLDASRKYQCYMPDITSCNISGKFPALHNTYNGYH